MNLVRLQRDQRQELEEGIKGKNIIEREQEQYFRKILDSGLIKVVSGIRRCGKSVLIYKLLTGKNFAYMNFDDERLSGIDAAGILPAFYEIYGKDFRHIFLDEVQNLENWDLLVNRLHRTGFNVIVTGSNSKLLSSELATHLTGRHITMELSPFSFREYLKATGFSEDIRTTKGESILRHELKNYLDAGGFPEIVVEKENPAIYLRELYRKIVETDIIGRYNITYKKTFREIAMNAISNPAKGISYNRIKKQFGLGSDHTVKNYLFYLEEAYLIHLLSRYSYKPVEIEKSEKKVYIIDTGIINHVSLRFSQDYGSLYENAVALELLRQKALNPLIEIYYWKNVAHEEVDFVVKDGLKIKELIQVCYNSDNPKTKEREVRALVNASKELKCDNLLVITYDKEGEEKISWFDVERKIKFMPLEKWLFEVNINMNTSQQSPSSGFPQ